jgi:hypothetical protein
MLIIFGFLLMSAFVVTADIGPGNSVETQGITVVTKVSATGSYTKDDSMVWRSSNEWLDVNGNIIPTTEDPFFTWEFTSEPPMNHVGEAQLVAGYSEKTDARRGVIDYSKTLILDNAAKALGQKNVDAHRNIQFEALPNSSGLISSDEQLFIDVAGWPQNKLKGTLCPFSEPDCYPSFCSIVQAGSSMDMASVSVITDAAQRTISTADNTQNPPVPVLVDIPVTLSYNINLQGSSFQEPAEGAVSAFMRVNSNEGRCPLSIGGNLQYQEDAFASNLINKFVASYAYESGVRRI